MKKNLASFGTALSRTEAKKIVGGLEEGEDLASCTFYCHCNETRIIRARCSTNPCSGSDDVGGTCGSTYHSCTDLCMYA